MTSSSPCAVRRAGPDDLQGVLGVHARHRADVPCSPSEREQETWRRMMGTPDLTVYVAELDGALIGTATTMVMPNLTYDCAPTAFVEAVVVVPGHRRRGIATAIMRQVLVDLRAAGCDKVQLLSHKRHASDGAHHLYAGLGFEPEAEGFRYYLRALPGDETAPRGGSRRS